MTTISENPALQTSKVPTGSPEAFPVASTWKRLSALYIDAVPVFLLMFIADPDLFSKFKGLFTTGTLTYTWTFLAISWLGTYLMRVTFLKWKGATPGKLLLGLRVINTESANPSLSWAQALLRPAAEMIFGYFGLTYTIALFDLKRRHLPDRAAFTRVVQFTPRSAVKKRWVIGSIIVFFNLFQLFTFPNTLRTMEFTSEGLTIRAMPPAVAPPVPPSDGI